MWPRGWAPSAPVQLLNTPGTARGCCCPGPGAAALGMCPHLPAGARRWMERGEGAQHQAQLWASPPRASAEQSPTSPQREAAGPGDLSQGQKGKLAAPCFPQRLCQISHQPPYGLEHGFLGDFIFINRKDLCKVLWVGFRNVFVKLPFDGNDFLMIFSPRFCLATTDFSLFTQ